LIAIICLAKIYFDKKGKETLWNFLFDLLEVNGWFVGWIALSAIFVLSANIIQCFTGIIVDEPLDGIHRIVSTALHLIL